jgi:hypothetical protein
MHDVKVIDDFLESASEWVCDEYFVDIRYFGEIVGVSYRLVSAAISVLPLPPSKDFNFSIDANKFFSGQIQKKCSKKEDLLKILNQAVSGGIDITGRVVHISSNNDSCSAYSPVVLRDAWFSPLQLNMYSSEQNFSYTLDLTSIDNTLRKSDPLFDGLNDLSNWLDIKIPTDSSQSAQINITISPPVDFLLTECVLFNNSLKIRLIAHPLFSVERVNLGVRVSPYDSLSGRIQLAQKIIWEASENNFQMGTVTIDLNRAESVLMMLMIGNVTVRRHWIIDPNKARNNRFLAIQHFDKDLAMIKHAIFNGKDGRYFECAISSLLFMLGFSSTMQVETDSPDLIVSTPEGKLIIIECTLKISDFSNKLGKLVTRRGTLFKYLKDSGHHADPIAILVCRQPRNEISAAHDDLTSHKVILICAEELEILLEKVRNFPNPDQLIVSYQNEFMRIENPMF